MTTDDERYEGHLDAIQNALKKCGELHIALSHGFTPLAVLIVGMSIFDALWRIGDKLEQRK